MNVLEKKKVVLLGMMSKFPVAGAVWGTMQYVVGLERLGYGRTTWRPTVARRPC